MCLKYIANNDLYSYRMKHETGNYPDPDHGFCSITGCTPINWRNQPYKNGDWIMGTVGKGCVQNNPYYTDFVDRLIYLMKVTEDTTQALYNQNCRYKIKEPTNFSERNKDFTCNYTFVGDNTNNNPNERVVIAELFWYFGNKAILIPECFKGVKGVVNKYRGMKFCGAPNNIIDRQIGDNFIDYIVKNYNPGIHGFPFHRAYFCYNHQEQKEFDFENKIAKSTRCSCVLDDNDDDE